MGIRDIIFTSAAVFLAAGCTGGQDSVSDASSGAPGIVAEMAEQAATRTCIDSGAADLGGPLAVLWTPGDRLGVYTDGGDANVEYTLSGTASVARGTFTASGSVDGEITHAYYPYDAGNASREASALAGEVLREQDMTAGTIPCDYKWGTPEGTDGDGNLRFRFHNLFPLVRFVIDATGTVLENETLQTVTLSAAKADGTEADLAGGFTFDATDGSHEVGTDVSRTLTTVWNRTLSGTLTGFATVFPEVGAGDRLTFTFETPDHRATLTVTSKVDFEPGMYYTFPLTLARFGGLKVEKTGTFTAATYNVDGLPDLSYGLGSINPDGPGSAGTTSISQKIAAEDWDIIGFSEDFEYHTQLESALGGYKFGTYRGTVTASALSSRADTDGLGFAVCTTSCTFTSETMKQFEHEYGGVSGGANTCIRKGLRHYVVALTGGTDAADDDVVIDVIITHMNTYSSGNFLTPASKWLNAQQGQLSEIAEYINTLAADSTPRPVILMGDTNCRYTRHDFQTYFWGVLDSDLVVNDPWVDYMWDGVYPTYPSNSLVVEDATGTSDTDIICSSQKGEVVDKIIYINDPDSPVQISANGYLRDYDGYSGLADHMPIVVEFTYCRTL